MEIRRFEYPLHKTTELAQFRNRTWLDIETRKAKDVKDWNPLSPFQVRWQTFMVGLAYVKDGVLVVEIAAGDCEDTLIRWVDCKLTAHGPETIYSATHDFDREILLGRFVNARRPSSPTAWGWPHLKGSYVWRNIRKVARNLDLSRASDVASRDVPATWGRGNRGIVYLHCLRDVVENVLEDPHVELGPADWTTLTRNFK